MNPEDLNEYKSGRYQRELEWYDRKSVQNRKWDRFTSGATVVLSAAVPIVILVSPPGALVGRVTAAILSAVVAILSGISKLYGFHDLYVNYRTIAESLKKEQYYYATGLEPYGSASDKEALFVNRVESLISRENTLWHEITERRTCEQTQILGTTRRPEGLDESLK